MAFACTIISRRLVVRKLDELPTIGAAILRSSARWSLTITANGTPVARRTCFALMNNTLLYSQLVVLHLRPAGNNYQVCTSSR